MKGDEIVRPCDRHSNETVRLYLQNTANLFLQNTVVPVIVLLKLLFVYQCYWLLYRFHRSQRPIIKVSHERVQRCYQFEVWITNGSSKFKPRCSKLGGDLNSVVCLRVTSPRGNSVLTNSYSLASILTNCIDEQILPFVSAVTP